MRHDESAVMLGRKITANKTKKTAYFESRPYENVELLKSDISKAFEKYAVDGVLYSEDMKAPYKRKQFHNVDEAIDYSFKNGIGWIYRKKKLI